MSTRQESSKKPKEPEEKAQKIKVSTSKKKAKSSENAEEHKDTDSLEKARHLYQCGNCRQILLSLFDINNRVYVNDDVPVRIVREVKKEYNLDVQSDNPLISPDTAYDALCVYYPICCKSCGAMIGKVYLSLTEELEILQRNIPILEESQIKIFDVNECKEVFTPAKPTTSTSGAKEQVTKGSNVKSLQNKAEIMAVTKAVSAEKESVMPTTTVTGIEYHHDLDHSKLFEVDSSFRDMGNILKSFANLIEQFDMRMTNAERIVRLMNEQITAVMKELSDSH